MRIAIDTRWIFPEISGISTYTLELVKELARLDRENDYILLFDSQAMLEKTSEFAQFNAAPNFRSVILPFGLFSLRNQVELPARLLDLNIQVFHSPNFMIPLRAFPRNHPGKIKCVVTIHDLIPLLFPDHAPRSKKSRFFWLYKWIMHEVGRRADKIITVSRSSANDVLRHLHIPARREEDVVPVYNGVSEDYKPAVVQPLNREPTILYVGRMDPYKNLPVLVEAFAAMLEEEHMFCRMIIIGPEDERYPEARESARAFGVENRIQWLGYVDQEELHRHYQQADVLVLPSRYEGFGLTVLEAMACGTPVICSSTSSLPEVAGDAGWLIDPDDAEGLAEAMRTVLTDKQTAQAMSRKGLIQVKRFTWELCARQTLNVYRSAMESE